MISNTPWNRSRKMKRDALPRLPRRPAALAARRASPPTSARSGSSAGRCSCSSATAARSAPSRSIGMVLFHVHITSTFPLGGPAGVEPVHDLRAPLPLRPLRRRPLSTLDDPLLIALILRRSASCIPVLGNLCPDKISFLPSMRYYAGNWATTQWLFRKDTGAEEKLDRDVNKVAPIVVEQLDELYDARRPSTCSTRGSPSARCTPTAGPSTGCSTAPSTTSTTTTCARASWSPASSTAGTSATATSTTSSCSTRCRSSAASPRATCA